MATKSLSPQLSKHSFIPKSHQRFEFTIPEFKDMSISNGPVQGSRDGLLLPDNIAESSDPVARWLTLRREALVEVKNNEGKSFMVARSLLVKSANSTLR